MGGRARLGRARGRLQPPCAGGVRAAQTLHVMADALTDAVRLSTGAAKPTAVYERMALFDEHTWCAAHPGGDALDGRESGALQWQSKAALAVEARDRADALLGAAAARFRSERSESILVLNPSGHARSDVVEVFLPGEPRRSGRSRRGRRRARRARAERARAARVEPQPAAGAGAVVRRPRRAGPRLPALRARRGRRRPEGARAGALENEHYRVELEVDGGHAVSVLDRELGLELVDTASAFGFAQVVRDLYGGPLQATGARPARRSPMRRAAGRTCWSRRATGRRTAWSSAARTRSRSAR